MGRGTWLAGLVFGGWWNAVAAMLEDANPAAWERMVGLYTACPPDDATELFEATMTARTIAPEPKVDGRARQMVRPSRR